jgi:hypothetical protein
MFIARSMHASYPRARMAEVGCNVRHPKAQVDFED